MKTPLAIGYTLLVGFLVAVAAPGCRTTTPSTAGDNHGCPVCDRETTLVPTKGLAYTKTACPECGKVRNQDSPIYDAIKEQQLGSHPDENVAICSHCEVVVQECAKCLKKRNSGKSPR